MIKFEYDHLMTYIYCDKCWKAIRRLHSELINKTTKHVCLGRDKQYLIKGNGKNFNINVLWRR